MLKRLIGLTALLFAALGVAAAPASALEIGDPAPPLAGKVDWLRGEPVSEYKAGEVYVLDFWAVWCGPCIQSIPHLAELQKEYADKKVNVIGLAIWPRGNQRADATENFIAKREDMAYRIAEDIQGQTAKAYMEAAGQNGIPTVMVVDQKGRIAWIGHPMGGLDDVLAKIVSGDFDVTAAKEEADRRASVVQRSIPIRRAFDQALQSRNWEQVVKHADELMALDSEAFAQAGLYKYHLLLTQLDRPEEAAAWGRTLLNEKLADQPDALNSLAWLISTNGDIAKKNARDIELAKAAAERACTQTDWEDASVIDTLAKVYAVEGNYSKAVEVQTKAVGAASSEDKDSYTQTLDEYKAKAAGN